MTQKGEVSKKGRIILSDTPIRFFAFMLEELFSIRMTLQKFIKFKIGKEKLLNSSDFDTLIEEHKSLIENIVQSFSIKGNHKLCTFSQI